MPAAIMLLGSTTWRGEGGHPILRGTPLDTRLALAQLMRDEGASAFIMEERDAAAGEDNFAFFRRLIREESVRTFVLFWPLGARLHGLDVEIGHLLSQMEEGRLDAREVYLLAERRLLSIHSGRAGSHGLSQGIEPGTMKIWWHEAVASGGGRTTRPSEPT